MTDSLLKPILVFFGAGTGGLLRYWFGTFVQNWWGPSFPMGTLLVNISGCLVMGFLAAAWFGPVPVREEYRLAVLVGVLGGYTTFSSFGYETLKLTTEGHYLRAGLYVLASVALSLMAVAIGAFTASKFYAVTP